MWYKELKLACEIALSQSLQMLVKRASRRMWFSQREQKIIFLAIRMSLEP